jgi:hypothetical protein
MVGHNHGLDKGMELEFCDPISRHLFDPGNLAGNRLGTEPAQFVSVAIRERSTQPGESDRIGVASCHGERLVPTASDQKRDMSLHGPGVTGFALNVIVLPMKRNGFTVEELSEHLHRLGEPGDPDGCGIKAKAIPLVFGESVSRTNAEFEPAVG